MAGYVTRFAPSPTGHLHLGHAFSALTAYDRAKAQNGSFLLRIEDIDRARCTPAFAAAIRDDLHWLGLVWPDPVMRQSDRLPAYADTLALLGAMGLTYPCTCTRSDIRAAMSAPQEGADGPDGPVYPGTCRGKRLADAASGDAIRLDMAKAMAGVGEVSFTENGPGLAGLHRFDADRMLTEAGDVVLGRRDIGTSYHLAVVTDDAVQGVTEVVRGEDLFTATATHVLLQRLLRLPLPHYHHHKLIRDEQGRRLAKRDDARALATYRDKGKTPQNIRAMLGL